MRLLLVSEYWSPKIMGGGEISAELLAKSLAKKGIDVSVLTSKFKGLKDYEKNQEFEIYRRLITGENPLRLIDNIKRSLLFYHSTKKEIINLFKEKKFDIIHCLNTSSIQGAVKTKNKLKVPIFATINSYHNFCPKGNLWYYEKEECTGATLNKCTGCIINSDYYGKNKLRWYLKYNPIFHLITYYLFYLRRISLKKVDHFIAISDFVNSIIKKHNLNNVSKIYNLSETNNKILHLSDLEEKTKNKFVITSLSNFDKQKGIDVLIKAFSK